MTANDEREVARRFHERTKHSPQSVRRDPHFLDWENQPLPFKLYRGLEELPLPEVEARGTPAMLDVMKGSGEIGGSLDLDTLSRLLFYTAGVTKRLRHAGGEMAFRAAACTGALYHVEAYVATGDIGGLRAGLYHYGPLKHVLTPLRSGDWRAVLVEATGGERHLARAEAVLVLTTTFWRNAWKYRTRAYRHAFWDSGTMLANFFVESDSLQLEHHLILGFADQAVHRLLDVDPAKEAAVALVAIGESRATQPSPPASAPEPLGYETEPLSPAEVDYPLIREMNEASALATGAEARLWRELVRPSLHDEAQSRPLVPLEGEPPPSGSVEEVIRKRGSSRRFGRAPITTDALATILRGAIRPVPRDAGPAETTLCETYLIVNAVEGLPSGAYAYHPDSASLEPLREGDFRSEARFLDLEQELAGEAAINAYFLVDLEEILECWGNRGYRLAQLEGGILGGRMYLGAYALGLGATGLTFYDDAVTQFFSPRAEGKSVMFLTAIGVPLKRPVLFQR